MIHQLDPVTVGQIAAGEVVERPLSVVKELVENAIDAGATRVQVNVEAGGLDLIEVIDDGGGIAPDELAIAVRRHATSKLAAAEDLESIGTLGFRGEGLASIAAVARVEVVSRRPDAEIGARIRTHAEEAGEREPFAAPVGTRVRAEGLFENVPVRREYLRASSAEFNRVSSWLSMFSLAYPNVTFVLRHDGKDVWTMPASSDVAQRLAMVFGKAAADALMPLGADAPGLNGTLSGFISSPGNDRGDRRMQILFVNGRLLRSTLLAGAWTAGYSTFAMTGRHPYGVLFLDVPPDHVEPNVHPTKSDVRLRFGTQIFDAVKRAISTTLRDRAAIRFETNVGGTGVSYAPAGIDASLEHVQSLFEHVHDDPGAVPGHRMRVLGQIHRTYILATDGDAILLVDQHAAHERIAYESIVARAQEAAPSEPLLVPISVELDASESDALERALDVLRDGGLEIEAFGDRAFRITATPAGYGSRPFDLRGFLEDLTEDRKQRDVRERIWASLACHSVTVAGERLEPDEMTTLLDRLQRCLNPMHCPHGRPTMVRLDPDDIGRMFKRL